MQAMFLRKVFICYGDETHKNVEAFAEHVFNLCGSSKCPAYGTREEILPAYFHIALRFAITYFISGNLCYLKLKYL